MIGPLFLKLNSKVAFEQTARPQTRKQINLLRGETSYMVTVCIIVRCNAG